METYETHCPDNLRIAKISSTLNQGTYRLVVDFFSSHQLIKQEARQVFLDFLRGKSLQEIAQQKKTIKNLRTADATKVRNTINKIINKLNEKLNSNYPTLEDNSPTEQASLRQILTNSGLTSDFLVTVCNWSKYN